MGNFKELAEQNKLRVLGAVHCLLIGQTKSGKTDWVARAAIDGWEIIYIDSDNGKSTLLSALQGHPDAMDRIHYFEPESIFDFCESMFTNSIFRYGETARASVSSHSAKPDEMVDEIRPTIIPPNVILVIDSWTAIANDLIHKIADKRKIDLFEADKYTREIYGPTGFKASELLFWIQNSPFHVIVQAHPGYYERKEKPAAGKAEDIRESDMLIRETTAIPLSTSNPHGFTMGKYFNYIGWTRVSGQERRELDFRVKKDTISGANFPAGTLLFGDPRGDMRFAKLFGKPPVVEPSETPWLRRITGAEFKEEKQSRDAKAPSNPKVLTGGKIETPPVTATPPVSTMNMLDKLKGLKT